MTHSTGDTVFAVIVTYNPDLVVLEQLLDALLPQVDQALILDNGSSNAMLQWSPPAAHPQLQLQRLGENLGIARAQNLGIEQARLAGARFVLLSDQDSEPAPDMVARLLDAARELQAAGRPFAAIGPCQLSPGADAPGPFSLTVGLRMQRMHHHDSPPLVEVDFLFASGCLIPMKVLEQVGGMAEPLFIDYVDIEWGLRARQAGYSSFGSFTARMTHRLGDGAVRIFGKSFSLHSPLRHYYIVRNAVWLYKQSNIPLNWRLRDGYVLLKRVLLYSVCGTPRRQQLPMMLRGLYHGLRSRLGRL